MARAIALAEEAVGRTSPNPTVGCVIVRDGEVVGEGYHPGAGHAHAEPIALAAAGGDARGATLYVTLEPCCTPGRTPPCTAAILASGVREVVYGTSDPNPAHSGRGIAELEAAGVATRQAGDQRTLRSLNRGFFSWMERGRPHVTAKVAVTLDGRVSLRAGKGTVLTGPQADEWTHRWRAMADAVLVGIGTALADDPLLTARPSVACGRQPVRVVLDSSGRLPAASQLVRTAGKSPVLVITTGRSRDAWRREVAEAGAEVLEIQAPGPGDRPGGRPASDGIEDADARRVPLLKALAALGERGLLDVACEPGPTLFATLLRVDALDVLHVIVTSWLGGDRGAPRLTCDELGVPGERSGVRAPLAGFERLGDDVLLTYDAAGWQTTAD